MQPATATPLPKPAPRRAWLPVLTLLAGLLLGAAAVSILSLLGLMPWNSGGRMMRCGGGQCPELQPGQAATLVVGGTGTLADRVRIEVPAGALVEPVAITVAMDEYELDLADVRHPGVGAFEVLGPTQVLEPHGQVFSAPVKVSLPYERDRLSDDFPVELLAVVVERRDEAAAGRWEVMRAVDVDRSRGELSILVQHFSKLTPIVDHDGFGALGLVSGMRDWNDGIMAPEACNEIRSVAGARDVVVDMEAFWERIGLGHHTSLGRVVKLGRYLDAEDGGEFPLGYLGFNQHQAPPDGTRGRALRDDPTPHPLGRGRQARLDGYPRHGSRGNEGADGGSQPARGDAHRPQCDAGAGPAPALERRLHRRQPGASVSTGGPHLRDAASLGWLRASPIRRDDARL